MSRPLLQVALGWIARGAVLASALVNTRLFIELLGVDGFAAVSVVLSLTPWFALLHMGVPQAAQNAVSRRRGSEEGHTEVGLAAARFAWLALAAAAPLSVALAWLVQQFLLEQHGDLSWGAIALLHFGMASMGVSLVFHQVMHAVHRSTWPVLAPGAQAVATTALLMAGTVAGWRSAWWVAGSIAGPMIAVFVASSLFARLSLRGPVDVAELRSLVVAGRPFAFFGLVGTVTLACDYLIMSRMLSSEAIAQYSVASRVFNAVLTLHAVLLSLAWTPIADRFAAHRHGAMRTLVRQLMLGGALLALCVGLPLALFLEPIVRWLSAGNLPPIPAALTASFFLLLVVRIWCDTFATVLLSCNQTNSIAGYIVWQCIVSLLAQTFLGWYWGASGIVLGMVLSFVLTAVWILPLRFGHLTASVARPT